MAQLNVVIDRSGLTGHMFIEIKNQAGAEDVYYGLNTGGLEQAEEQPEYNRDALIPFNIPDAQAQNIRDWVDRNSFGWWLFDYNCVDFVYDALKVGGIPIDETDKDVFPGNNIDEIEEAKRKYENLPGFWDQFFDRLNNWINPEVNRLFQFAQVRIDPLALDLDGDGVETIGINDWQSTVLFDHDADGQRTGTGWINADDGLLVRDLDGNGVIDSGRELFGDQTRLTNGALAGDAYAALADLDSNPDGRIDANDAAFAQLQVWQDRNQDGISQADELSTLAERGIQSLSTLNQTNGNWNNGNILLASGEYQRTDGTTGVTGGLAFGTSNFFSAFQDNIAVTDQVRLLPDMHGSGQVRDLRQAASLSSGLAGTLQGFTDASLHSQQWAMMDGLLRGWAGTSGMQTMERRARGYW